jgi:hypothetical protein
MKKVLLALLLSTTPAFAGSIDFTQLLIGVDGKALFQGGDDCLPQPADKPPLIPGRTCSKSDLSLSDVSVGALESMLESDRNEDAKKRFERDLLARKVYKQSAIVLSAEEVTLIKDRIGKAYGPSIVGAAWPLLDPSLTEKK